MLPQPSMRFALENASVCDMNATYLFGHVLIALLVAGEQLVSDHVLLPQHLVLLLHLQVRLYAQQTKQVKKRAD